MTNLIITVDDSKKKLKFTGDKIALGERVAVEVVGIDIDANTRLRVLVGDTTIAIGGAWEGSKCELNLFTVQAEKIHCGYGRIVLDNPEANKLYGIGELELLPWPKERGEDVPYDLGNYPDVIEDFRNEINEKFTAHDSEIESALRNVEYSNETFKREQLERQNTFEETVNSNVANKADVAALEEEVTARENADNALSARINTNKTNIETNAANVSKVNTAIETEVSDRVKAVEAEKQSRLVAEGMIGERISAEITRATSRENEIEATANRSMQKAEEVEDSIKNLVNNAPEALDTLEEIANYIKQDETGTAAILNDIASIREDKANRTELETKADKKEVSRIKDTLDANNVFINEFWDYNQAEHVGFNEQISTLNESVKNLTDSKFDKPTSGKVLLGLDATDDSTGKSVVIGSKANTTGNGSVAIGYEANATNSDGGIAIGHLAKISGMRGYNAGAVAIGIGAEADQDTPIVIGTSQGAFAKRAQIKVTNTGVMTVGGAPMAKEATVAELAERVESLEENDSGSSVDVVAEIAGKEIKPSSVVIERLEDDLKYILKLSDNFSYELMYEGDRVFKFSSSWEGLFKNIPKYTSSYADVAIENHPDTGKDVSVVTPRVFKSNYLSFEIYAITRVYLKVLRNEDENLDVRETLRDFMLVVDIKADVEAPSIIWVYWEYPEVTFHPRGGDAANLEVVAGKRNVFFITEVHPNVFMVARDELALPNAGGNAE